MDEFCKTIFLETTDSTKLISLFEICGVIDFHDIVELTDETLMKMEKYIFDFLSHESQIDRYLDPLFIYRQNEFLFSSDAKIKIRKSVEKIKERHRNEIDNKTNNQSTDKPTETKRNESKIESNQSSSSNYSEIIRKKKEILSLWAQNVIERVSKKFTDVKLEFKEDFDLDINIQKTESGPKCSGLFLCYFCRNLKGQTKSIKFSVSKENYVILSNVITHLKLHFSPSDKLVFPVN